jgi:hypothetical protein
MVSRTITFVRGSTQPIASLKLTILGTPLKRSHDEVRVADIPRCLIGSCASIGLVPLHELTFCTLRSS